MYDADTLLQRWLADESDRAERAWDNLINAIRKAPNIPLHDLDKWIELNHQLPRTGRDDRRPRPKIVDKLTKRQEQVLQMYASGLSREEIGQRLGISPETVKNHFARARYRLGALTSANAVAIAIREGFIK
jgi:DNA-binding CsgD family transcriptional regulator